MMMPTFEWMTCSYSLKFPLKSDKWLKDFWHQKFTFSCMKYECDTTLSTPYRWWGGNDIVLIIINVETAVLYHWTNKVNKLLMTRQVGWWTFMMWDRLSWVTLYFSLYQLLMDGWESLTSLLHRMGMGWDSWLFNLAWSLLLMPKVPFSGHNLHTRGWGDMKMKGEPNRDSNPVPPSQETPQGHERKLINLLLPRKVMKQYCIINKNLWN